MSCSHVVVVDSRARRAVIKVTPSTPLSDVLQEARSKLGLGAESYGLRRNNKQIDLSRTIRLSGLSSGAKLELVVQSRSPSVVSVALQLPDSDTRDRSPGRLVDKFPSVTTLWLVLRKFESGPTIEGGGRAVPHNFTARGVPQMADGVSGSGRLYYETPVLQFMERELSTFTDLQKTLGQLGLNSGSALFRLSFRPTQQPLEEAMLEIDRYFKSVESDSRSGAHSESVSTMESLPDPAKPDPGLGMEVATTTLPETLLGEEGKETTPAPETDIAGNAMPTESDEQRGTVEQATIGPDERPVSIFAPPSNTTPQAVNHSYNEQDYQPTIDHAKQHQSRLAMSGRNKRLPSEAELAAQREATSRKGSNVKDVELKIRLPDQSQLVSKFTTSDSVATLYEFVQSMLQHPDQPFTLSYSSPNGPRVLRRRMATTDTKTNHDDGPVNTARLIGDLGFGGRMLVIFAWDPSVADSVGRSSSSSVLKPSFVAMAKELQVDDPGNHEALGRHRGSSSQSGVDTKASGAGGGGRKGGGMPKWLKLPGKK